MRLVDKIKNFFFHGVPDPRDYYPEPKTMYVAGSRLAFENWRQQQISDAEDNRPYYDPWRAVHIRWAISVRGRQFAPEQFIRLHDYWWLPDVADIEAYVQLAHLMEEANRQEDAA